jgi:hypothetical protein
VTGISRGRTRQLKSCVGKLDITKKQASRLGVPAYKRLSPVLETCCLLLSANESYKNAEADLETLTGVKVGHSTQHRRVQTFELSLPDAKQAITEVCIDGGKVRLRGSQGQESYWRDYKAVRLQNLYYGGFFQDNLSLTDWVNTQRLTNPLFCLGDGHDGVWNLFEEIASPHSRQEILDWYHLRENLYKVGGSIKRLKQAETRLWQGQVDEASALFANCRRKQADNFCAYLAKHRHRLINYRDFQQQQLSSVGSGAVESAVKQIDRRLKISGAQWKLENVCRILYLRCAYLNGLLAA